MIDFRSAPRRGAFEARVLDKMAAGIHAQHGKRKAAAIGAMSGTVLELGPGTGANMRYYSPGTRLIAIEPNPAMHDRLRAAADEHGVELELRELRGERLDLDDDSVDAAVATLVLCGVDDPAQVVAEVQRVVRPGGTFFFLEHVAAPAGTKVRRVQGMLKRPHRWLFNGCEVDRDTETLLRESGFSELDVERVDSGWQGFYTRHQVVGTAVVA